MKEVDEKVKRPCLRYYGGKWRLAPWIIEFFPRHRCYTEAFGGAASVLMRKARSYAEVYNDLDEEVVNVFRILRDEETSSRLRRLLELTPYSRSEFYESYKASPCAIEGARRTIVKAFMGFGSASIHDNRPQGMRTSSSMWKAPTGYRACSSWSGTTPAHDWMRYPESIDRFCSRLRGVVIENRPAVEIISQHDSVDTLHFVDPPYVLSTKNRREYKHEMNDGEQHKALAAHLRTVKGLVVISGYPSALYDEVYSGWECHRRRAFANGARARTEAVWLSPTTVAALRAEGQTLNFPA